MIDRPLLWTPAQRKRASILYFANVFFLSSVPQNYLDVSHEKLFSGQLPTRVVVGLVKNDAFNGHVGRNPFNFQHFNLSEISLYLDGHQQHAVKLWPPYSPALVNGGSRKFYT